MEKDHIYIDEDRIDIIADRKKLLTLYTMLTEELIKATSPEAVDICIKVAKQEQGV